MSDLTGLRFEHRTSMNMQQFINDRAWDDSFDQKHHEVEEILSPFWDAEYDWDRLIKGSDSSDDLNGF